MGVNSLHWYYTPDLGQAGEEASLSGDEWHHCHHVMRMQAGASIILCDGKGKCMESAIVSASSKEGRLQLIQDHSLHFINPRTYYLSIGIAPTKNIDRIEFAIEKLVEIGVEEIYLLDCHHNERSHLRLDRLEKIAVAASKQSRKSRFPTIHPFVTPGDLVNAKSIAGKKTILACHLDEASGTLDQNYSPGQDVIMLIGPEGGFSENEINLIKKGNGKTVSLGPFRLRVETAAIVACANIHFMNQKPV